MNSMSVLVGPSDTVSISTVESDPFVVPGVLLGDVVKVSCVNAVDEQGKKVINAMSLEFLRRSPFYYIRGTWLEKTPLPVPEKPKKKGAKDDDKPVEPKYQGFVFNSDGTAKAINMPKYKLKSWSLVDSTLTMVYVTEGAVSTKGKTQTKDSSDKKKSSKSNVELMDVSETYTVSSINDETLVLSRGENVIWDLRRKQ
ncbi:MAG: lipocalin family protein [Bacteroidales bacterium]|nr:lipocalin family protein [Bacteroidales bacterium]